nr:putative ribonuclease H-like domain-containing protein [Tanacetum cinerariifolium]
MKTLTVESPIPTVSLPVPTACLNDSSKPSSEARLISKRVANREETPSLDNILSLTNRFEDILEVTTSSDETIRVKADDPAFPAKVYKVEKAMYGLHQAPRAWYGTLSKYLLKNGFQRGTIDQTLFIKRQREDFILVQVYVDDIIFGSSNPQLSREFESLMQEKFQMSAMDDLRYLKGHPKLGLWYPKASPLDLVAFSDSDYGGASQDRKSTNGGSQFSGTRLISWQCKKQTIVATSTIEAEYVAVASCCGQVLWIQNQLLDYGYNFMNTKIYIDNNSAICIVKNPVYHSKTKHIEIRHHFIRDCFEKRLICVDHIHTNKNVADLLKKAFDAGRFQYLVGEFNSDFHPMVEFIAASPLRIKTTNEGTHILATIDGIQRIVSESSLRRNLELRDEDGIISILDTELFENLTLMG